MQPQATRTFGADLRMIVYIYLALVAVVALFDLDEVFPPIRGNQLTNASEVLHSCLWVQSPLPLLKSEKEASFECWSRHQALSGLVASLDVGSMNPVAEFTRATSTDRGTPVLEIRVIM